MLSMSHEFLPSAYALFTLFCLFSLSRLVQRGQAHAPSKEAPTLPYQYPIVRSTIQFAFYGPELFQELLTSFCALSGALRVRLVNEDIYMVHGAKNITAVSQNVHLRVTKAYGYALRHCFGMSKAAAAAYDRDTSGSREKPIAGSRVGEHGRIGHVTHANLAQGLLVDGLEPMTGRFHAALSQALEACEIGQDWKHYDDLAAFFEDVLGRAVLESVFGPLLLQTNPTFVRDLFEYDKTVMDLARRVPWFLKPLPYRLRGVLVESVKRWHAAASSSSSSSVPEPDSSTAWAGWGSSMLQARYEKLMQCDGQDADSVASANFALLWASVTNIVPSTLIMAAHTFGDPGLLRELRTAMGAQDGDPTATRRPDDLAKVPLLASLYAETLRFGVQIHIPRDAPHHTVQVGNSILPKKSFIMMNTWLAHSDAEAWNTQDGRRPLDQFWPHRFLVYPDDPTSGPSSKPCAPTAQGLPNESKKQAVFSTDGLQGSWIPYGSGHHACPGRLLAKRMMLHTVALLVRCYDMEALPVNRLPAFASPRFGFGVKKLAQRTPFRIRQRRLGEGRS